jgi:hypothetical protein
MANSQLSEGDDFYHQIAKWGLYMAEGEIIDTLSAIPETDGFCTKNFAKLLLINFPQSALQSLSIS